MLAKKGWPKTAHFEYVFPLLSSVDVFCLVCLAEQAGRGECLTCLLELLRAPPRPGIRPPPLLGLGMVLLAPRLVGHPAASSTLVVGLWHVVVIFVQYTVFFRWFDNDFCTVMKVVCILFEEDDGALFCESETGFIGPIPAGGLMVP